MVFVQHFGQQFKRSFDNLVHISAVALCFEISGIIVSFKSNSGSNFANIGENVMRFNALILYSFDRKFWTFLVFWTLFFRDMAICFEYSSIKDGFNSGFFTSVRLNLYLIFL